MKQVYFFICCFFVFCASSVQSQINYQSGFTDAVEKTPDFLSNSTKVHTESVYKIPQKSTLLEEWKEQESMLSNHIIGFYIHQLLWGRFTISYERLFADKTIGIKIPISLTYDPYARSTTSTGNKKFFTPTNFPSTEPTAKTSSSRTSSVPKQLKRVLHGKTVNSPDSLPKPFIQKGPQKDKISSVSKAENIQIWVILHPYSSHKSLHYSNSVTQIT